MKPSSEIKVRGHGHRMKTFCTVVCATVVDAASSYSLLTICYQCLLTLLPLLVQNYYHCHICGYHVQ